MQGITLIELMVTIAIAAILLGLGVPSFSNYIASNRLTAQTNELVVAMHFARAESIKRNRTISFCRAANATATACAGGDDNSNWEHWVILAGSTLLRSGTVSSGVRVRSSITNNQLRFQPDGLARVGSGDTLANSVTLTACSPNHGSVARRVVSLGAGSRISTTTGAGGCT